MNTSIANKMLLAFKSACKKYQIEEKVIEHATQLEISDGKNRAIVNIYHTGKIGPPGGKQTALREELKKIKKEIETNAEAFSDSTTCESKSCTTTYDILLEEFRQKIRTSLHNVTSEIEIENKPKTNIQYKAKLRRNGSSLTITQYSNGTLMLQGKDDVLHHNVCDLIDKIANPSEKEVTARFLSGDEKSLAVFTAKYTPELTEKAEINVKAKLGSTYDFLEPYDRKYFVAAESLLIANIPLPEYSPIVMPASKAFEGLAKKIVVGIGLYQPGSIDFSILNDRTNPNRKSVCNKETHCDTFLVDLSVAIKKFRHFMMHSDTSNVTKVDTYVEAEEKLEEIYKESKKFFDYFNSVFILSK
jgi:hypothetical protein